MRSATVASSDLPAPPTGGIASARFDRVLLTVLALLLSYHVYYCLSSQKIPDWDASMGFLTLQSSLEHGDFNRLHHPALDNLAEDRAEFVAWWTPGQYLIPHWVARTLGVDIGMALRLLSAACSGGGLLGYALLYAKLGFSRTTGLISLIVLCSQSYFLATSRTYLGGELLLFGAAPYLALGVLSVGPSLGWRALTAAAGCFLALFLKASALVLFLSLVAYLALEILDWPGGRLRPGPAWRVSVRRCLVLGAIAAVYALAIQLAYLSRGVTISASAGTLAAFSADRWWGVAVAQAGPLYGAFSFLEPYRNTTFFIPVAVASLLAVGKLGSGFAGGPTLLYRRMLVAHFLVFTFFFSYAYLRGMDISHDSRHFRGVGLLLLPGLVHAVLHFRARTVVAGLIVLLALASVIVYHRQYHTGPAAVTSASRWGLRLPVSNASVEAMHRVDERYVTKDTIVFNGFGACPALLLEFSHGRRLADDNLAYFGFKPRDRAVVPWYRGPAADIVLLVSKNNPWYFGASLEEIARTFERPLQVVPLFENDELVIYRGSAR